MSDSWLRSLEYIPPAIIKRLLDGFRWEGTPDSGSMALTFDDGPDPEVTPAVLDALDGANARGTFFLVGENVRKNPAVARRIVERGHAIGNHTMTHPRLLFMRRAEVEAEIDEAQRIIADATGMEPTLFRPPYGMVDFTSARVARDREFDVVLWTVLSGDYSDASEEVVLQRVRPFIRSGAIAVFHDTGRGGGAGLPEIIQKIGVTAREAGVRLGGVDELSVSDEIMLSEDHAD